MTWKILLMLAALLFAWDDSPVAPTGEFMATASAPPVAQQKESAIVPLEGLDPVLLTQGKEAQGDERFAVTRGRFRYLFAGAETKAVFEKEPGRYEIQLNGSCARMGPSTQGNPDLYYIHKGRIYIFGSPQCLTMFKTAPEKYLEPEAPAATAVSASEDAKKRGRALIERAVEAAGGAARIDGLVSYQERWSVSRQTPQGVTELKTALFVNFPDKVRTERTFPFGTIVTVVTPSDGFLTLPRETAELTADQRADFMQQYRRRLLMLLRARREEGFTAAAAGPGKAGDVSVEHVDVWYGGFSARLGLDAATGRILTLSFRGRGNTGAFGEIVQTFSDFRPTGGLTLPFKTTATFDGAADPAQSPTVETIVVNGEVPPALFERPKTPAGGGQ